MGIGFDRAGGGITRPDYSQVLSGSENDKVLPLEQQLPSSPYPSLFPAGWVDDTGIYLMGGLVNLHVNNDPITDEGFKFSFSDWRWNKLSYTLPRSLYGGVGTTIGGTHILTGGFSSDYRNETYEVDVQNGTFSQVATQPGNEWEAWWATDWDDKLWLGGGFGLPGGERDTTIHEYSVSSQTWTQLGNMPSQIYSCYGVYNPNDSLIYVFGGFDNTDTRIASISTYDPNADTWSDSVASLNFGISSIPLGMINGFPTAIGVGRGADPTGYYIDPSDNSINEVLTSTILLQATARVLHNGVYYFFSGTSDFGDNVNDVKSYAYKRTI